MDVIRRAACLVLVFAVTGAGASMASAPTGAIAAAAATVAAGAVPLPAGSVATYANPVVPQDFPDPHIIRVDDRWYAYGTAGNHVQGMVSTDLAHWSRIADPLVGVPAWSTSGYLWAPTVLRIGAAYVMHYTTRETASGLPCIAAAVSSSPAGPFRQASLAGPFLCQRDRNGSIDPASTIDTEGSPWLVWQSQGVTGREPPHLWSQRLTADGLGLVGVAADLLHQDQEWEYPIVEAPVLVRKGTAWHLFYSGNRWETGFYAVGHAVCAGPAGPCTKDPGPPLLASRPDRDDIGPGSVSVFDDASGALWLGYHAWGAAHVGYAQGGRRTVHLATLSFVGDRPVVDAPTRGVAARLLGGSYSVGWDGEVRAWDGAPFLGRPHWDADLARGIAVAPDGGGYVVLDGWGGVHRFGSAVSGLAGAAATPYWPGWDIARSVAFTPSGRGIYVLDGWGGVHPAGDARPDLQAAYWPGWDIARSIAPTPSGAGLYLLDGWGGVHIVGDALPGLSHAYWPGWDIAESIALTPTGTGLAVLDGWGGVHVGGDAPNAAGAAYRAGAGWRSLALLADRTYLLAGNPGPPRPA